MLSSTLGKIDGVDVGQHPLVLKLMKGAYNRKPPAPKYSRFWDVGMVVDFLITLGPNNVLPFPHLSRKFALLLALSTFCRVSELANITRDSITFDGTQARFPLAKPKKSQRSSPLQVISLKRLQPSSLACPVETLIDYIAASESFRQRPDSKLLFLGLRSPRHSVGASTIAR